MKNYTRYFSSLSLATCLALTNAVANEKDTNSLGEVSIIETTIDSHVKSITSKKLENLQASDIKDILKSMPSVVVDGNARYSQKVYVRGLEDKSSNITIDGARISGQLFHHSGDQTIDAQMLKIGSIELGPNSALSGPGVINGSFVYETKDPSDYLQEDETFGGQVGASYQSAYGRKGFDVAVFSKVNDKLEFVGIGNISDDNKLEIPGVEDIESKESTLKSGLVKLIFKPNNENIFKLSYNKYEDGGDRQLAGEKVGSNSPTVDPHNEISRDSYSLNYNYNPKSDLVNLEAKVYKTTQSLEIEGDNNIDGAYWLWEKGVNQITDEPTMNFENRSKGIDLRNTTFLSNHKITYGASYDNDEQEAIADGLARYVTGPKAGQTVDLSVSGGETKEYALYLEDEIQLDKFLLTFGARYDVHKLSGVYSGRNSQVSPKFKGEYQVTDNLKLRTGYGRIFKGPSLGETMLLVYGVSKNTHHAQAQTGNNFELGFDYDLSNILGADNSSFGFTAYKYNVDNYMHPTKNLKLTNQNDIKIWGIESVFRYTKDDLSLSLSHTYTDGEAEDLATGEKYDHFTSNIHTFKVDADYEVNEQLYLNYNAEFVPGNKIKNSFQTKKEKRSGYGVHNIATTYSLKTLKGAKLSLGIDNIFDKKYTRHTAFGAYWGEPDSGSYEVGRNFKVKLSYKF
ncbi:TonB-dependent receptor [Arcobacter sp. CECT 8983]|uniref:TonB-dependent receptor plug domain-containing protein n=1 Tax=Arcobacter sp. CECT 8983 TaxID=2044508 RepID=UPI00100B07D2|nr:TonB-dependent receptor [Arcobacter sp. CECT 8983]RXJ90346.1 TonB-dependent receptor [Arcobacter sp. CECT 8983]